MRDTSQHRELRGWLQPVVRVFDKARSGGFELPAELEQAHAHLTAVQSAIAGVAWPADPATTKAKIAEAVSLRSPVPTDLGKRQRAAESAYDEAGAQTEVLRVAETAAARQLRVVFDSLAEEIVVDGLRPALEAVLDGATKLAPKLKGAQDANALVALDDDAALKAWSALGVAHGRYLAVREAYDVVFQAVFGGEIDASSPEMGGLVRYRNWFELPKQHGAAVMPVEPAAIMVWLVAGNGEVSPEPWLPLPDEIEPVVAQARERVKAAQVAGYQAAGARRAASQRREMREQEEREADAEPFAGFRTS